MWFARAARAPTTSPGSSRSRNPGGEIRRRRGLGAPRRPHDRLERLARCTIGPRLAALLESDELGKPALTISVSRSKRRYPDWTRESIARFRFATLPISLASAPQNRRMSPTASSTSSLFVRVTTNSAIPSFVSPVFGAHAGPTEQQGRGETVDVEAREVGVALQRRACPGEGCRDLSGQRGGFDPRWLPCSGEVVPVGHAPASFATGPRAPSAESRHRASAQAGGAEEVDDVAHSAQQDVATACAPRCRGGTLPR